MEIDLDYHLMIFIDFQALRNHTPKTMKSGRRGTGLSLISQGNESFFRWYNLSAISSSRTKVRKNISTPSASLPTIHIHPSQFGPTKKQAPSSKESSTPESTVLVIPTVSKPQKGSDLQILQGSNLLKVVGYHGDARNPPSTKSWKLQV